MSIVIGLLLLLGVVFILMEAFRTPPRAFLWGWMGLALVVIAGAVGGRAVILA